MRVSFRPELLLRWMMLAIATLGAGCLRAGYLSRDAATDRPTVDSRATADLPSAARELRLPDAPRDTRRHDQPRLDLALAPDAGSHPDLAPDAGSPPDLAPDAGSPPDLAHDAGSPPDLAHDAGSPPDLAHDAGSPPDLAHDAGSPPDLACLAASSQPSSSGGYLYVWSERRFGQTFVATASGTLREVELYLQCMNGGEQKNVWVALLATLGGVPTGSPLAERSLGPLVAGWKKVVVDFSAAALKLTAGVRYALQVRSDGPAPPVHHGLAFGSASSLGSDSLWVKLPLASSWALAPTLISTLKSTDALYFRVEVCP